jgi:hypothetical protein
MWFYEMVQAFKRQPPNMKPHSKSFEGGILRRPVGR